MLVLAPKRSAVQRGVVQEPEHASSPAGDECCKVGLAHTVL